MYWSGTDPDGRRDGGRVAVSGMPPDKMTEWLERQGYTNIELAEEPPDGFRQTITDGDGNPIAGESPADRRARAAGAPPTGSGPDGDEPDDGDPAAPAARRRNAGAPPPGAEPDDVPPDADTRSPGERFRDEYAALTPEQRKLYDAVDERASYDGSDARNVLDRAAGSPEDKAAVAELFGGPGAGDEFRNRDQRMADREADRAAAREAHRTGELPWDDYQNRMRELDAADDAENTLDVQDRLRTAYDEIANDPARARRIMPDVVGVDELREKVGDVPKPVFDHAMQELATHPDAGLEPGGAADFYAGPNDAEKAAAVPFGGAQGVRFRMGVDYEGRSPEALAHQLGAEGRSPRETDSVLRRLDDGAVADIADRLGVDTSDSPPPDILRERISDHAADVRDVRRAESARFHADATTLYEAEADLDNIGDWEPERRTAVREAAARRHDTGDTYVSDRAQKLAPAVAEADLADAWDRYGDLALELDNGDDTQKTKDGLHAAMLDLADAVDRTFAPGPVSDDGDLVTNYRAAKARRAELADAKNDEWGLMDVERADADREFDQAAGRLAAYGYDNFDPR